MATIGELGDMDPAAWDRAALLNAVEVAAFLLVAAAIVARLTPEERAEFAAGLQDGTFSPEGARAADAQSRVQRAAVAIWNKVRPRNRAEVIAYAGLLLALVQALQGIGPAAEQPVEVHVTVTTPTSSAPSTSLSAPATPNGADPTAVPDVRPIPLAPPRDDTEAGEPQGS